MKKEFLELLTRFLFFILIVHSPLVHSKFLLEPSFKVTNGRYYTSNNKGSLTGETINLNTGYIGEYIFAGFSIEKGHYKYSEKIENATSFNGGGIGTFLGFHFLNRFKIWTNYLNSSLEPTNQTSRRYFGQFVSFGIGYRLFGNVVLNIESFKNQFTQIEDDKTGKTSGLSENIKTVGQSVSLSFLFVY